MASPISSASFINLLNFLNKYLRFDSSESSISTKHTKLKFDAIISTCEILAKKFVLVKTPKMA